MKKKTARIFFKSMPLIAAGRPKKLEARKNLGGLPIKFLVFSAMKLTSFTAFQGSLAGDFPGILTISMQEFSHFLCF